MLYVKQTLEYRFMRNIKKGSCWEWTAKDNYHGYGRFTFEKTKYPAHRFSWIFHFGKIPSGLYVCHHCDNRKCVKPDHLFLGTPKENSQDALKKGRLIIPRNTHHIGACGEKNKFAKLKNVEVIEIRKLIAIGMMQTEIASKFGVTNKAINHIARKRRWKHI